MPGFLSQELFTNFSGVRAWRAGMYGMSTLRMRRRRQ